VQECGNSALPYQGSSIMNMKLLEICAFIFTVTSGVFWLHPSAKPQDRKVRVWVFLANAEAGAIVQSVEAKFNSTMRYETVRNTMQTDLILIVACLRAEDERNSLRDQWVCSSALQVVTGDLVAVPHDAGNNLVIGNPSFIAQGIFEKVVSHSGDRELQAKRDFFRKEICAYCKTFNCSEDVK
jgi:hypothetical protein